VKIEILPSAREDLAEGFVFYEKQQPGLGAYFLDSLFTDIDSLAIHGGIHRHVCVPFGGAYGLEPKRYSVAALYERRQGTDNPRCIFGGHRPSLQARRLAAKRESPTADSGARN
jgi:hypothetical protein